MNLDQNPTVDQLKDLLRSHSDRGGHHVIWVTRGGDVRITTTPRGPIPGWDQPALPDAQLRFETSPGGYGYVGEEAADNPDWPPELLGLLLSEWQRAKGRPELVRAARW